ncbi:prepilin peptidase [Pseudonocardia alni]|uniref:prepilin peptidase n=1 Tax=Pseudonocardia alni TaxID=33907 RepID=UPI00331BAFFB
MLAFTSLCVRTLPGRPEVASVTALTGLAVGLALTRHPGGAVLLAPLATLGCAAAVVDAREGRLPDRLTGPLLGCTLLAGIVEYGVGAIAVAAAGAIIVTLLKLAASAAIGWGDVKLAPTLAVVLADHGTLFRGIALACAMVALTAGAVALADRRNPSMPRSGVPYGPALVLGTLGAAAL